MAGRVKCDQKKAKRKGPKGDTATKRRGKRTQEDYVTEQPEEKEQSKKKKENLLPRPRKRRVSLTPACLGLESWLLIYQSSMIDWLKPSLPGGLEVQYHWHFVPAATMDQQPPGFRHILPAPSAATAGPDDYASRRSTRDSEDARDSASGSGSGSASGSGSGGRNLRRHAPAACGHCRRKKIKVGEA